MPLTSQGERDLALLEELVEQYAFELSDREHEAFAEMRDDLSIVRWRELTAKQRAWAEETADRVGIVAPCANLVSEGKVPRGREVEPTCPKCGGSGSRIQYGLVRGSNRDKALRDGAVLGGCMVSEDSPRWACNACRHTWGRVGDPR